MPARLGLVLVLCAAVLGAGCAPSVPTAPPETTVYLVRHAEKEAGDDPALTAQGAARARALAEQLGGEPIVAVYSSQFRRAVDTAAPLAARLGVEVDVLRIEGPEVGETLRSQARRIAEDHRGRSALVAGHSNTVPTMIAELTGTPMADLDESEYGDLFVVTIQADGSARLDRRRFGD